MAYSGSDDPCRLPARLASGGRLGWRRLLASDGLAMPDGAELYDVGTTLQVESCARDVAGGRTLPVSTVINYPDLPVIHPRYCEGRDDRYHGHGKKKPVHLESPPEPRKHSTELAGRN